MFLTFWTRIVCYVFASYIAFILQLYLQFFGYFNSKFFVMKVHHIQTSQRCNWKGGNRPHKGSDNDCLQSTSWRILASRSFFRCMHADDAVVIALRCRVVHLFILSADSCRCVFVRQSAPRVARSHHCTLCQNNLLLSVMCRESALCGDHLMSVHVKYFLFFCRIKLWSQMSSIVLCRTVYRAHPDTDVKLST